MPLNAYEDECDGRVLLSFLGRRIVSSPYISANVDDIPFFDSNVSLFGVSVLSQKMTSYFISDKISGNIFSASILYL